MKDRLGHEMIMASAGSGKTYALVKRFIRLLALGVEPDRIIALTFTRKAAGEFLQKIFLRLTDAALSAAEADRLSREIHAGEGKPEFFARLLAGMVLRIGHLQLSTIDSYFGRIVSAFPYELGLTRQHRIMDEFERNVARAQAMERLLAGGDPDRENRILQLYKQMTWGAEEKNVYGIFEERLQESHDFFLESPRRELWGGARAIFPGQPWWLGEGEDIPSLVGRIEEQLLELELKKGFQNAFNSLLSVVLKWEPGQELKGGTLLDRLFQVREELREGTPEIEYSRNRLVIPQPLGSFLYRLLQHYVRCEISAQLVRTESLGKLLGEFDTLYEQSVRETGSLVFSDLPMLLVKGLGTDHPALDMQEIIYRLDSRSDHWLVDEFQDTSRIQWRVLHGLVDEILQDESGRRSFFYVGDVKQSIYAWRGGDPRLFGEIYEHYKRGGKGIERSSLHISWRSAPPVLDSVNAVFGTGISERLFAKPVVNRWRAQWSEHRASDKTSGLSGYAGWGLVESSDDLAGACIQVIRDADPLRTGHSCAVLVRSNKEVNALTQALRENGIPASMEGTVRIARDNVVGNWILAFFYSMARPDEAFPRAYLAMPGIAVKGTEYRRLAGLVRSDLSDNGFAEAVRRLLEHLDGPALREDFLKRRSEQLLEAAARFDGSGIGGLERFISFLETVTVEESTLSSQVQVMTVHKAKGLDFDMVVVAGFGAGAMVRSRSHSLHVQRNAVGEVQWVMELPRKAVLEQDPVLNAACTEQEEDHEFEALCLLYVAMTRARQGLYCLAEAPTGNSSRTTWHDLFTGACGGGNEREDGLITWRREWGHPAWHQALADKEAPPASSAMLEPLPGTLPAIQPSLRRMASPSRESHHDQKFSPTLRSAEGRRFGTRMHDFLATVKWVPASGRPSLPADAEPDLVQRLHELLATDLGREVFTEPHEACLLWREKPYVLRVEEEVANGIIDRAHIHLDAEGRPCRAVIYDFKTDKLDPERPVEEQLMERYALQVARYRQAVSVLTGLPEERIETRLVPV